MAERRRNRTKRDSFQNALAQACSSVHPLVLLLTLVTIGCQDATHREQALPGPPVEPVDDSLSALNATVTSSRRNAITQAVESAVPAIVSVNVIEVQRLRVQDPLSDLFNDPFFGQFFEPRVVERQVQNLGSGFLISPDGYIVTNDHVVGNATKITVSLPSGETLDARLVGTDKASDLALVKVDPASALPHLAFHANEVPIVGEWAIALGNPFGLFEAAQPTVTVGVVSGTGRNLGQQSGRIYRDMIQTDASINRGNSGGPLLNALGRVIGVNTAIYSESGGSVGVGFAVPAWKAIRIVEELRANGAVDRSYYTGLRGVDVTQRIALALKLESAQGVMVESVERGSPAEAAGLMQYDIIVALEGERIASLDDYIARLHDFRPGDRITHSVLRSGRRLEISLHTGSTRE